MAAPLNATSAPAAAGASPVPEDDFMAARQLWKTNDAAGLRALIRQAQLALTWAEDDERRLGLPVAAPGCYDGGLPDLDQEVAVAYDTNEPTTESQGPVLVECTITANIRAGSLAGDLLTATELACNLLGRPARVEAGADPGVWLVELNPDELIELNAAGRFVRVSESTCLTAELP